MAETTANTDTLAPARIGKEIHLKPITSDPEPTHVPTYVPAGIDELYDRDNDPRATSSLPSPMVPTKYLSPMTGGTSALTR